MRDVQEVIRELMTNLATKDHKKLDVEGLVRIGYNRTTAEHLVRGWKEAAEKGGGRG